MSFKLNEATIVAIFIEDEELPLIHGNVLHSLHIVASSKLTLPTLVFSFTDSLQLIPKMKLQDGARIGVYIKSTVSHTRYFRVHSWTRAPAGDGFSYSITAYWDSTKYWSGTTCFGISGSSHNALREIAELCGLKFANSNTQTADKMTWMPQNKPYGIFAREIARYGFVNDKSHMSLGVDSLGVMRYINLNALAEPVVTVGYLAPKDTSNFLMLSDFQPSNLAGTGNALLGYRHNRQTPTVLGSSAGGGALMTEETELSLTPDSRYPSVNTEVRATQNRGLVSYSPVSFGNVHDKYERARYQNARYDVLKSLQGEFLFPFQTEFEMFNTLKYVAPPDMNNKEYNGKYTIGAKVIYIAGSTYQEKLIGFKTGLDA